MKFATIIDNGHNQAGIVSEESGEFYSFVQMKQAVPHLHEMPESLLDFITVSDRWMPALADIKLDDVLGRGKKLESLQWAPPIPKPTKNLFCVGKNYADHAKELGATSLPEHLILFTKAPTTVTGHLEPVPLHADVTKELDYEGELAIVIGKQGKGIKAENALNHIFGYTILNDVTGRDLQSRHQQYFLGKSLDGSCPIGPWIVHHSSVGNANSLHITTKVNGEIRQQSNTEKFIFSIEAIIETISKGMTLEPGDIIATGTPAGVGKGFTPPRFLKTGDQIDIEIEKIGLLSNKIE